MSQHTPTPWMCSENPAAVGTLQSNEIVIRPKGEYPHGDWIADCGRLGDDTARANAEFIVRAVNNFEALLKMLKTVHVEGAGLHYEAIAELIKQAEGKKP